MAGWIAKTTRTISNPLQGRPCGLAAAAAAAAAKAELGLESILCGGRNNNSLKKSLNSQSAKDFRIGNEERERKRRGGGGKSYQKKEKQDIEGICDWVLLPIQRENDHFRARICNCRIRKGTKKRRYAFDGLTSDIEANTVETADGARHDTGVGKDTAANQGVVDESGGIELESASDLPNLLHCLC